MWIENEALTGQVVTLEPLTEAHIEPLQRAVADGEGWKLWYASVPTVAAIPEYVRQAMAAAERGDIAYAVRSRASGDIVGTTRYYNVDAANRRAMIGYTWYAAAVRRSAVNTECKLLLLGQLFEQAGAVAVEFRTHFFNQASRAAIERLGAKQDGILRNHQIMADGSYRDTVVYSIIASEWPAVKNNLLSKMQP
ncbi:GNAT family N-acetyltransferase [Marinobacter xestospongiae]|uniref:GNAT family N-acetyltransferase n=1 Tax=Marinobacter xestospongiae TaxID=994319 RepID=UPI002003DAB6|nr:GNAT family protein [Marinobacter xestospongiae]MCK7568065.1 GNAT family N-acetyltransferase [Marinobacter xestospongiae]